MQLLTGHHHLKGHLFKLGLVDSPRWVMQTVTWNSLTCSLWPWGRGGIKI